MTKLKKSERLEIIKEIISSQEIETQHDLVDELHKRGIDLTQATISRDMVALGIIKKPVGQGRVVYALTTADKTKTNANYPVVSKTVLTVSQHNSTWPAALNIMVVPGSSQVLKHYLLDHFPDLIFSLMSDDDSLLLLAVDERAAGQLRQHLTHPNED